MQVPDVTQGTSGTVRKTEGLSFVLVGTESESDRFGRTQSASYLGIPGGIHSWLVYWTRQRARLVCLV